MTTKQTAKRPSKPQQRVAAPCAFCPTVVMAWNPGIDLCASCVALENALDAGVDLRNVAELIEFESAEREREEERRRRRTQCLGRCGATVPDPREAGVRTRTRGQGWCPACFALLSRDRETVVQRVADVMRRSGVEDAERLIDAVERLARISIRNGIPGRGRGGVPIAPATAR